jgi:hypothetical protein
MRAYKEYHLLGYNTVLSVVSKRRFGGTYRLQFKAE